MNAPSHALINQLIDTLSDWQWSHAYDRYSFRIRAEHLVKLIDDQRAKEAAEGREKAA